MPDPSDPVPSPSDNTPADPVPDLSDPVPALSHPALLILPRLIVRLPWFEDVDLERSAAAADCSSALLLLLQLAAVPAGVGVTPTSRHERPVPYAGCGHSCTTGFLLWSGQCTGN